MSTVDTLGTFAPPTTAPVAYLDGSHTATAAAPPSRQAPRSPPNGPAHGTERTRRTAPSRGEYKHVRVQNLSPRHKKRRALALETLTQQPFYHSLPTTDRAYFDQVVASLRSAPYLVSPQTLEPSVGSPAGLQLVGPRRSTGPGTAAARESVYAILVDRHLDGDYVCWICGEKRADRRLPAHSIAFHFEHRPYHCMETHANLRTGLASVW